MLFWLKFKLDDRGIAAAEVILIVAAISIPLLVALMAFSEDIVGYLNEQVQDLKK